MTRLGLRKDGTSIYRPPGEAKFVTSEHLDLEQHLVDVALLPVPPRITPENFRAAFTSAEGWGTLAQKVEGGRMKAEIALRYGKLRAFSIALALPEKMLANQVRVTLNGREIEAKHAVAGNKLTLTLAADANISANEKLEITIS